MNKLDNFSERLKNCVDKEVNFAEIEDVYFSALLDDIESSLNEYFSEDVNFGLLNNIKNAGSAFKNTLSEGIQNDRAKKGQGLKNEFDNVSAEQKYIKVLIELFQDDAKNFPKGKKTFDKVVKLLQKIDGFINKRLEKISKNKKFQAAKEKSGNQQTTNNKSNEPSNPSVQMMPERA